MSSSQERLVAQLARVVELLRTTGTVAIDGMAGVGKTGHTDLVDTASRARARINAIALDGLRTGALHPLPGEPPDTALLSQRWQRQTGNPRPS